MARGQRDPKGKCKSLCDYYITAQVKHDQVGKRSIHISQETKINIKLDLFKCNDTISLGIIVYVHPNYVNRTDLTKEIKDIIYRMGTTSTEVIEKWIMENDIVEGEVANPKFIIVTSVMKYVKLLKRIETMTLNILCVAKDGLYLKLILAETWNNQEKLHRIFVPACTNLVTS